MGFAFTFAMAAYNLIRLPSPDNSLTTCVSCPSARHRDDDQRLRQVTP
jgi:hypothetical protein